MSEYGFVYITASFIGGASGRAYHKGEVIPVVAIDPSGAVLIDGAAEAAGAALCYLPEQEDRGYWHLSGRVLWAKDMVTLTKARLLS